MTAHVQPIELTIRDRVLRGAHHVPAGEGPFPTAVLHHGFGAQRTEVSRSFVVLARALTARGVAAVAMDRAGHGESDGDFASTTVSGDIVDAIETLHRIAGLDAVDEADLHLVGMSLGSVIASVVAAECGREIRSLTLWSPAAVFVDEIRSGHLQGESTSEVGRQGYFDFQGMRLGPGFFEDAVEFDVYGRARGYGGPVRVLHGDRDFIPASYAERYRSVYGERLEYTLVAGADHGWDHVPVREILLAETTSFILRHLRPGSSADEGR